MGRRGRDFVERSSGEKLLDTLLATCAICSAATLDLHPFSSRFLGKLGNERRMEDKAVATCKIFGEDALDERRKSVS